MPPSVSKILLKRGATAKAEAYVGESGELLVDVGLKTVRVLDGTTPGGVQLARLSDIAAGQSGSAVKLATARAIALSGDASGSASFDGSQDVTIAVTASNAIARVAADGTIAAATGIQLVLDCRER